MRFHKHPVGRASRWHSVRVRHEQVWDWCAHHEDVDRYQRRRREVMTGPRSRDGLKLQAAH